MIYEFSNKTQTRKQQELVADQRYIPLFGMSLGSGGHNPFHFGDSSSFT
jgi:hypothetical protein